MGKVFGRSLYRCTEGALSTPPPLFRPINSYHCASTNPMSVFLLMVSPGNLIVCVALHGLLFVVANQYFHSHTVSPPSHSSAIDTAHVALEQQLQGVQPGFTVGKVGTTLRQDGLAAVGKVDRQVIIRACRGSIRVCRRAVHITCRPCACSCVPFPGKEVEGPT
jgi:hypothetical protein